MSTFRSCRSGFPLVLVTAVFLIGCSKDPEKEKAEAFASGNQYFSKQQYKEAIVEYRRAIQLDPRFGEARAKLGEAYLNTKDVAAAYSQTVRAADLLPNNTEVQLRAANLLLAAGKFEDAKTRADHVLSRSPKNVDALVARGNALASLKDLDGALTDFEKAAAADPTRGLIQSNIGAVQMAKGAPAEAEAAFKAATEAAPQSPLARVAYANFLWVTNRREAAEAELKTAVSIAPKDPVVRRALVLLYLSAGRPSDAEPHLRALADNATEPSGRFALARFYFATNRPQDAIRELTTLAARKDSYAEATLEIAAARYRAGETVEARNLLRQVLATVPDHPRAHVLEGEFFVQEHKWTEAIAAAKSALAKDPQLVAAHFVLGLAYQGNRDFDEARNAFNEVLKLEPNATGAQVALAELHLLNRDPATARQLAAAAAARAPGSPEAQATLIKSMLAGQQLKEAEAAIRTFQTTFPKSEEGYVLEGRLQTIRKNLVGAEKAFVRAEEMNPQSIDAATGRVLTMFASGRAGEAKVYVDQLTTRYGTDVRFVALAARTYAVLGDYGRAEPLLRRTLEMDPSLTETYGTLAQLYLRQGKREQALAEFQSLAAKQPKSVTAKTMVAVLLQSSNRRPEAKEAYRQTLGLNQKAPVAANNLAWMLAEDNEDLDNALQLAQSAKAALPDSPEAADTLGFVYLKKGLIDQAIAEFKEAVMKEPGTAGFHYRLGFAYAKTRDLAAARQSLERGLGLDAKAPEAAEARETLARLSRLGS